jgi:hypothetical protein
MKCNKEELRPPDVSPRGPRKNQRPGGTHRPHPPGRPEPASQETRKQPPATDRRTLRVRPQQPPTTPNGTPSPPTPATPTTEVTHPPPKRRPPRATRRNTPEDQALLIVSAVKTVKTYKYKNIVLMCILLFHEPEYSIQEKELPPIISHIKLLYITIIWYKTLLIYFHNISIVIRLSEYFCYNFQWP